VSTDLTSFNVIAHLYSKGARTLNITAFSLMAFSIMTLSIMTLSITTLSIAS